MSVFLPSTAEKDLAKFALSLQQIAAGRSNAIGSVTLAAGATSTVVSAINCAPGSAVFLFPKTADAAPVASPPTFSVKKQIFTASGTYTPSAGMVYCVIEGVGSGGAGGGVVGGAALSVGGGGGGAGGYSRLLATAATIGASQTVTIGAAGAGVSGANGTDGADCSLGTLLIAKGGGKGFAGLSTQLGAGGPGGIAGTGDLTSVGAAGTNGGYNSTRGTATVLAHAGTGGSSQFGGGATQSQISGSNTTAGVAAGNYGSGGSGAVSDATASSAAGGNASKGIIIVTEYCYAAPAAIAPTFVSSVGKQTFTISHDNNAIADRTFYYVCLG